MCGLRAALGFAALALAATGVATGATTAGLTPAPAAAAATLQQRKQEAAQKRQQAQAQLDLARASDDQVQAQVDRLDAAVVVQTARVAAANQAVSALSRQIADATAALNRLEARTAAARRSLAEVAVAGYMSPASEDVVTQVLQAADLTQAARRQAYLVNIETSTTEALDTLRADRQDEVAAAQHLATLKVGAQGRAHTEAAVATQLRSAQAAQQAAHTELQKRIAELQGETAAYAAQENDLEALIRAAQAAQAAQAGAVTGPVSNIGLIWPVHGPVTSEFGPRWGGFHPGIDIGVGYGTPIQAAKAGTVIFAGYYGGYGNFVVIDHGGGVATAYAHQSRIAVSQGEAVQQGQVIGYVGSTGYSTGPHLHFEVRIDGVAQNPRRYEVGSP